MALTIGVFDHVDRSGRPLQEFYENRLKLIEGYDRLGIDIYHVAEHHSTPLGMAASPAVFLSAVAQRTKRLRFGPMVFTVPFYHPLRLIEEICMLDQMSGGRLEMGVGKGISPIETRFYGLDPKESDERFAEGLEVVLKGLASRTLNHEGKFYQFKDVPLELEVKQKPHPPLWYGVVNSGSAERAGKRGMSVVTNQPAHTLAPIADAYWSAFKGHGQPRFGANRYIVIAETDAAALEIARRAYRVWYSSFIHLWKQHGMPPVGVAYPAEWDGQVKDGLAISGTAKTVRDILQRQLDESGINFIGCRFAFGDLSLAESMRSLEMFAADVRPHLRVKERVAATA